MFNTEHSSLSNCNFNFIGLRTLADPELQPGASIPLRPGRRLPPDLSGQGVLYSRNPFYIALAYDMRFLLNFIAPCDAPCICST